MFFRKLRHSFLAFWLGLLALGACGVEQYQLNGSVLWAAITEAGGSQLAHSPDHANVTGGAEFQVSPKMPADCPMRTAAGHTHRGHADCPLCGAEAALALFTFAVIVLFFGPAVSPQPPWAFEAIAASDHSTPSPYRSRAPPIAN